VTIVPVIVVPQLTATTFYPGPGRLVAITIESIIGPAGAGSVAIGIGTADLTAQNFRYAANLLAFVQADNSSGTAELNLFKTFPANRVLSATTEVVAVLTGGTNASIVTFSVERS